MSADPLQVALSAPRPISVDEHAAIRREMLAGIVTEPDFDEIDEAIDDMIVVDPYAGDPPSRRSDKETARILTLLDNLESERGNH